QIDETGTENRGPGWVDTALQLEAEQPFWTDTADISTLFTNSQLGNAITVTNNGKYECWPVWTITGPFVNLQIANSTTGYAIKLTAGAGINFSAGHTLTIDLRPGQKTILKEDLTNQASFLTSDSVLWPLAVGANNIIFTMTGNTSATTATVTYRQRYRAP